MALSGSDKIGNRLVRVLCIRTVERVFYPGIFDQAPRPETAMSTVQGQCIRFDNTDRFHTIKHFRVHFPHFRCIDRIYDHTHKRMIGFGQPAFLAHTIRIVDIDTLVVLITQWDIVVDAVIAHEQQVIAALIACNLFVQSKVFYEFHRILLSFMTIQPIALLQIAYQCISEFLL